jgi:glycosyltransferase involved in cell wall biosynthesis
LLSSEPIMPIRDAHPARPSTARPAVIILGPLWPRSGPTRLIQNQIDYYRARGYFTVFLGVAIDKDPVRGCEIWEELREGFGDLGADCVLLAGLDQEKWLTTKISSSVRHILRGTALDWIVDIGKSAVLEDADLRFVRDLPVEIIHVNYVYTLGFALRLRRQWLRSGSSVPIILETHDVQSHLLQDRGDLNPWTRHPDSFERLLKSELKLLNKAEVLVHLSLDDIEFFKAQLPKMPQVLAMPTVEERFTSSVNSASTPVADPIDLLFIGQAHLPNLAGIQWFFAQVWPLVADRRYNLKIVGKVCGLVQERSPQVYESFRSCFVGPVADLGHYYRAARCILAPMVSGSGISIKTIEALALGKPFVGTSKAFRGMPIDRIKQAGLQAYDDPQAFADAVVRALSDEHQAGSVSRAIYESVFSAEATFAARDQAVGIATGTPSFASAFAKMGVLNRT